MTRVGLFVFFVRTEKLLLYLIFGDMWGLRIDDLTGFNITEKKHLGSKSVRLKPKGISKLSGHDGCLCACMCVGRLENVLFLQHLLR